MKKITLIMTRRAQYQDKIVSGFEAHIKQLIPFDQHSITIVETKSGELEKIKSVIRQEIKTKPNLIIAFGTRVSLATREVYARRKSHIPVICVATGEPKQAGLPINKDPLRTTMTGVSHRMPPTILPAQVLLSAQPDVTEYFIMYHTLIQGSRAELDAVKIKNFITECKRNATIVPFTENPVEALKKAGAQSGAAVLSPIASININDGKTLSKYCKKNKLHLFLNADGIMPKGALWGYSAGVEMLGLNAAKYAYEILINKKPVAKLPWILFDNPSRPVFDPTALPEGIAPPGDEVVYDADTGRHLCYVKHNYAYLALWNSVLDNKLFTSLGKHGQPNASGVEASARYFDGWPANKEFTSTQLEQTIRSDEEVIVVYGQHATKLLQEKMLKLNTFKKMLTVRPADDCNTPMPAASNKQWPKSKKLRPSTMIIPAYEADRFASIISFMWPHATSISIAHAVGEGEERPRVLTERLIRFREFYKRRGVGVSDFGSWDTKELMTMAYEEATKSDVMAWFPDLMRPLDAKEYEDWAEHHAAYVAGGDRDSLKDMHVSYEYETNTLSARIFMALLQYLQKEVMPDVIDLSQDKNLLQLTCNTHRCNIDDNEWHEGLTALFELRQEPILERAGPKVQKKSRADRYE